MKNHLIHQAAKTSTFASFFLVTTIGPPLKNSPPPKKRTNMAGNETSAVFFYFFIYLPFMGGCLSIVISSFRGSSESTPMSETDAFFRPGGGGRFHHRRAGTRQAGHGGLNVDLCWCGSMELNQVLKTKMTMANPKLGGGFKDFLFSPLFGWMMDVRLFPTISNL